MQPACEAILFLHAIGFLRPRARPRVTELAPSLLQFPPQEAGVPNCVRSERLAHLLVRRPRKSKGKRWPSLWASLGPPQASNQPLTARPYAPEEPLFDTRRKPSARFAAHPRHEDRGRQDCIEPVLLRIRPRPDTSGLPQRDPVQ